MESLINGAKSALLNPDLAPVWFRQLLHNNVFDGRTFHVTLHEVQTQPNAETTASSTDVSDVRTLFDHVNPVHRAQSQQGPNGSLKLVKVHSMEPGDYLHLLKLFEIDHVALLVLNSGPFHFQHFQNPVKVVGGPQVISFGLAFNVATILWSFNPSTGAVRAVAIGEDDTPLNAEQVQRFRTDLTHALALGLFALQVHLEGSHGKNRQLVKRLRDVENETGHRGKSQAAGSMDFKIFERLDLDSISQVVSNIHYHGFSLQRTFVAMKKIFGEMNDLMDGDALGQPLKSAMNDPAFRTSLTWRLKAIESLLEQIQYLLNRVGIQETVVVNLRSKRDTEYSLRLSSASAKSAVASTELAKATQKDSSSMQTIAVVTMALLPATYFAALFAMPLLRWDQQPVIQDQFWIYLAFTLPSTAVVFLLWIVITKTDLVTRLLLWSQIHSKPTPV